MTTMSPDTVEISPTEVERTQFEPPMAYRPDPPRDGKGRYLIQTDTTRKAEGYQRSTNTVKALDDTFHLQRWQQRMVAKGVVMKPHLASMVSAHLEDNKSNRDILNGVCSDAMAAAGSTERRDRGIALHSLAQQIDAGVTPQFMDNADAADLAAYMQWRLDNNVGVISSELVIVNDELKVAGTFDRVYEIDGEWYIGDLKTGTSVDLGLNVYAAQFAFYAHGDLYTYPEGCTCSKFQKKTEACAVEHQRIPVVGVSQKKALLVHLPAGEARCESRWVDIEKGWVGVQLAIAVKDYRRMDVKV